jgi:hypothetical protein
MVDIRRRVQAEKGQPGELAQQKAGHEERANRRLAELQAQREARREARENRRREIQEQREARLKEKSLAKRVVPVVKDKSPSTLEKQFARFKARRSMFFTDSSYASDLRDWWESQDRFIRRRELAAFLGVETETVSCWFGSKKFPQEKMCDTLFSLTGLECFSSQRRREARREHFLNRAKKGLRRCNRATKLQHDDGKVFSGIGRESGRGISRTA